MTTASEIIPTRDELMAETASALKQRYQKLTGVAINPRSKAILVDKVLDLLTAPAKAAPAKAAPSPAAPVTGGKVDEEAMARDALERVGGAWSTWERLVDEKKDRLADLNKKISDTNGKLDKVIKDDSIDATTRVAHVEANWTQLQTLRAKKSYISKDYNKRIKDARTMIGKTIKDVRQIPLPLDN